MSAAMFNRVTFSILYKRMLVLLCLWYALQTHAQYSPVQITTQLLPPYSVQLSDYATPGNEKLRLIVLQRDLTKPSYQVRLQVSVELNGSVIMRTSPSSNPPPITLDAGVPMIISGPDLQPYLDSRHLDFTGISREQYERTKSLPEGSYQICFSAYDYRRQDVLVSNNGCSFFWLAKSEPPQVNTPPCGTALAFQNPQQIVFSWLPRNTTSPSSANTTEYEVSLYEIRVDRDPNDVVLSSQPMFATKTSLTQLVYGPADPILLKGMKYAWRVRAVDKEGKDAFRNDGYSEACTFTYGGEGASTIQLLAVENLQASGKTDRIGTASWNSQEGVERYRVEYRKKGANNRWFSQNAEGDTLSLFDLVPKTKYELKVRAEAGSSFGPYSDVVEFETQPKKVHQCGEEAPAVPEKGKPLPFLLINTIVDVQGLDLTVSKVEGPVGEGLYNGEGTVSVPYLGGASFHVTFSQLFVNDQHQATGGRVDFVTKGVDKWVEEELEKQHREKLAQQHKENQEKWAQTVFYKDMIIYDTEIKSISIDDNGNILIEGVNGEKYVNTAIPPILAAGEAVIIQGKCRNEEEGDCDQWVVEDGKVTKVEGGGLSPTMNVIVTKDALNIVMQALKGLGEKYNDEELAGLKVELNKSWESYDELDKEINKESYDDNKSDETYGSTESIHIEWSEQLTDEEIQDMKEFEKEELSRLGWDAKSAELLLNIGRVLHDFGRKPEKRAPQLARDVKVNDMRVSEYITDRKKNASDSEIVGEIEIAIEAFIREKLIDLEKRAFDKYVKDLEKE